VKAMEKLLAAAISGIISIHAAQAWGNDVEGQWGPTIGWNIIPIHSVLTPQGHVLSFGTDKAGNQMGGLYYDLWDPAKGTGPDAHQLLPNHSPTDLFCAAQVVLPATGEVMMSGGDNNAGGIAANPNTTLFDGALKTMTDGGVKMAFPRWYPTNTTLPDGDVLVQGGSAVGVDGPGIITPEVYNREKGWRSLFGATSQLAYDNGFNEWWYPRSWVLSNGQIFNLSGPAMFFIEHEGDGAIQMAGTFKGDNKGATSTALMYRPDRILQVGGGAPSDLQKHIDGSNKATKLSFVPESEASERLKVVTEPAAPMNYKRHWATSTMLPDGRVLVTGGAHRNNLLDGEGPALHAELWDPDSDSWRVLAAEQHARLYHSTAILLPDATVLSGGGGSPGPWVNGKELRNFNAQIFKPPYLFDGEALAPRPTYAVGTQSLTYGGTLGLSYESAKPIARVTLLKTGAVTHSFNNDQWFLELGFTATAPNELEIALPDNSRLATPGFYMLFLIDDAGVPSKARIFHFAPPDTQPDEQDLIIDGGFEYPTLSEDGSGEWRDFSAGTTFGAWTVESGSISLHLNSHRGLGKGASGLQHLDLNGHAPGEASQVLKGLTIGRRYKVDFSYARHDYAGQGLALGISIAEHKQRIAVTNAGSDHWLRGTLEFEASAAEERLVFSGLGGRDCCGVLLDDISVTPSASGGVENSKTPGEY